MVSRIHDLAKVLLAAAAIAAVACGDDSPSAPSGGGGSCATISIANNTVTPKNVTVAPGCQVTFVNNDAIVHEMVSDPHPVHTDCPAINGVGPLNANQSRQTGNLNDRKTCGFHDHLRDTVEGLRGTITVQ